MANWKPLYSQTPGEMLGQVCNQETSWKELEVIMERGRCYLSDRPSLSEQWKAIVARTQAILDARQCIQAVVAETQCDYKSLKVAACLMRHSDVIACTPDTLQKLLDAGLLVTSSLLRLMVKDLRNHTLDNLRILFENYEFDDDQKGDFLFEAVRYYTKPHYPVIKFLLENGASPRYFRLHTPTIAKLSTRRDSFEAFKLMLLYGMNSLQPTRLKTTPAELRRQFGFDDHEEWERPTLVSVALLYDGNEDLIKMSIRNGARMPPASVFQKRPNGTIRLMSILGHDCQKWIESKCLTPSIHRLFWFAMETHRHIWRKELHWTFTDTQRKRIETALMCLRRHHMPIVITEMVLRQTPIDN